jgi:hypothetical protein
MTSQMRRTVSLLALVFTLAISFATTAMAQHPHNWAQRHPTMSGMAVGIGTTMYLKHKAAYDRAHGIRPNFAERHPYMSGMAAGGVTHHLLKKAAH